MANIPGKKEKTINGQTQEFPHNRGEGGGEVNALTLEIITDVAKATKRQLRTRKRAKMAERDCPHFRCSNCRSVIDQIGVQS